MGLPNMIPVKHLPQPIQGLISSVLPSFALFANSLSHRLGRPIIQASHFPFAINSSATQGSLIRETVVTGIETCFLISSLAGICGAGAVPLAGIELPLLMVFPPDT